MDPADEPVPSQSAAVTDNGNPEVFPVVEGETTVATELVAEEVPSEHPAGSVAASEGFEVPVGNQSDGPPPGIPELDTINEPHHSDTVSDASTEAMTAPIVVDTPVLSTANSTLRTTETEVSRRQLPPTEIGGQMEGLELPPPPIHLDVQSASDVSGEDVQQMLSVLPVASLAPVPKPASELFVTTHELELRAKGQPDIMSNGSTPSTPPTPDDMISPTRGSLGVGLPSFGDADPNDRSHTFLLPPSTDCLKQSKPPKLSKLSIVGTVPSTSELSKMSKQKIPPDCLEHVRGMLQRAKDRADPLIVPGSEVSDGGTTGSILKLTEMEEQMGRSVLRQNEITLREQIVAGMGQSSPRRPRKRTVEERKARSERKRQKELNRLAELRMLEVQRLQALNNPQQAKRPPTEMERIREENSKSITKQLQRDLKKFTPPFAGSPSDFLDRGVVASPHQMIGTHTPDGSDVSYHQLAASLRRAYWVNRIDRDQQAAEEQFKRSQQKPSSPLQYLSKLDPTAAASVTRQPDFKTSFERFQFELVHGPSDDIDTTSELLAERRRRWK
eukprot:TRINITY_DN28332_c0_g1_i1.p1 TRINITY_DN28332_c0_g1~~TRINITY_DN28332_c0_g1_i1.p1  ORF type:complete len:558 (+),score=137.69 TRINITY_DN28332_c0_g1_i1:50-1723(+)